MKQFLMIFVIGILLSGCQLIPIKTIGQVEEVTPTPVVTAIPIREDETIDVSITQNRTIQIIASKPIVFENKGQTDVELTLTLDREIKTTLIPGGKYSFAYPTGLKSALFTWPGSQVILKQE